MDPDLLVAKQDYEKLERTHLKAGFREGMEAGKELVTKRGFKAGFKGGVEASVRWARLKGRLSAAELYLSQQDRPVSEELSQLKEQVERSCRERRGGEVEGGRKVKEEEDDEDDMREFWEVVESVSMPSELAELEHKVDDVIHRLE